MSRQLLKVVELFAGAGGMALGFAKAGFNHHTLIECNPHALATLTKNKNRHIPLIANGQIYQNDVRTFDYGQISSPIHLVIGGPPCQPFSIGGKHRGNSDRRDMFPEAVRAVRELRPYGFVFENVKGILRKSFTEYLRYILLQLTYPLKIREQDESWPEHLARLEKTHRIGSGEDLAYNIGWRSLNAANYGVPQTRERVFIVGFRSDLTIEWSFPEPTHSHEALLRSQWVTGQYWEKHRIPRSKRPEAPAKFQRKIEKIRLSPPLFTHPFIRPWQTVRDAIGDLPNPTIESNRKTILNHDLRLGAKSYPGHTGSAIDEPAKTLKAGDHGVPGGENMLRSLDGSVRYFTVRESARLQTFPDDYFISGSWTESMRQLGNAVPVTLSEIIAKSIYDRLINYCSPSFNAFSV
jgi:DNA (cytosine-5)-methyltransferase 1